MPEERVHGLKSTRSSASSKPAFGRKMQSPHETPLLLQLPFHSSVRLILSSFSAACSTSLVCTLEGDCSTLSNLSDLRSSNYSNLSWIPSSSVKAMDLHTSHRWVPACGSFSPTFPRTSKSHPHSRNTPGSTPHMLLPTTLLVACDGFHTGS